MFAALREDRRARVAMPDGYKIKQYIASITAEYPILGCERVRFALDGLKLIVKKSGSEETQQQFYNSWTQGHYVGNIFLFVLDGCICAMAINAPRSFHDLHIMDILGMYHLVEWLCLEYGVACLVDSAFRYNLHPWLIRSAQNPRENLTQEEIAMFHKATLVCQLTEWGMGTFQSAFPRTKDRPRICDRPERRYMLEMKVCLNNLRAELVGINQICTTFMPNLINPAFNMLVNI